MSKEEEKKNACCSEECCKNCDCGEIKTDIADLLRKIATKLECCNC